MVSNQRIPTQASPLLQIRPAPNSFLSLRVSEREVNSLHSCILCTFMIIYLISIYNAAKSNVLYFPNKKGPNYADNLSWHLGEVCVKSSMSYNHLEIPLNLKLDPGKGHPMLAGKEDKHTSEQLNPIPVSKLYKRVVRPSVLYGCGSYGVIIVQRRYEP